MLLIGIGVMSLTSMQSIRFSAGVNKCETLFVGQAWSLQDVYKDALGCRYWSLHLTTQGLAGSARLAVLSIQLGPWVLVMIQISPVSMRICLRCKLQW